MIRLLIVVMLLSGFSLQANPRRLTDFGVRSPLEGELVTPQTQTPQTAPGFGGAPMEMKEWHSHFSPLGSRRSSLLNQRYAADVERPESIGLSQASINMDPRRPANETLLNWNRVRENIISERFSHTELQTPQVREFQEMVDQLSLRDINRFQAIRNKTDDGIPVQQVGDPQNVQMSDDALDSIDVSGDATPVTDFNATTETVTDPSGTRTYRRTERTQDGLIKETTTSARIKDE